MNNDKPQLWLKKLLALEQCTHAEPSYSVEGVFQYVDFIYINGDLIGYGNFQLVRPDSYLLRIEYLAFDKFEFIYCASESMETVYTTKAKKSADLSLQYRHHTVYQAELNDGEHTVLLERVSELPLLKIKKMFLDKRLMYTPEDFFCLRR